MNKRAPSTQKVKKINAASLVLRQSNLQAIQTVCPVASRQVSSKESVWAHVSILITSYNFHLEGKNSHKILPPSVSTDDMLHFLNETVVRTYITKKER